ncbi:MAG: TonB-dependent receptor [Gammaproteobacteria bacterium]
MYIRLFSTFALGLSLFSFNVFAQEDSEYTGRTVEEVVTTALRQESSLQETAITVTAITGDGLEARQIENMEDLQFAVPTLGFQKGAYSGSGITLRGIGNFCVGNSCSDALGVFWNGQVASTSALYEAELFDIERVEVLRGPQGTLFGDGTTAGVLQIVTQKPGDSFGGYVKTDLGDYNSVRLSAAVDLPLSERLRSRIAVASLRRDGFVVNSYNNDELDDRNTQAARLTLEFDYDEDTLMRLTYEHTNADDNRLRAARQYCKAHPVLGCSGIEDGMDAVFSAGGYGHWLAYFMLQQSGLGYSDARNNPSKSIRSVDLDYTPWHTATNTQALFEIEHQLTDGVKMDFSYAYSTRDYEDSADYDHSVSVVPYAMGPITTWQHWDRLSQSGPIVGTNTYASNGTIDYSATESEWAQTELRFYSDFDGDFNFSGGFFYLESQSQVDYDLAAPYMNYYGNTSNGPICAIFSYTCNLGGAPFWITWFQNLPVAQAMVPGLIAAGAITPAQAQGFVLNYAATVATNTAKGACLLKRGPCGPLPNWQQMYQNDSNVTRNTFGVYAELYFDLSDKTTLTLGARNTEYEINNMTYFSLLDLQGNAAGYYGADRPLPIPRNFDATKSTYKIGFDHQLNEDNLLYGTFSTGFKPGGSNPTSTSGDGVPGDFGAEEAEVFEIGLKSTLLDGRLQINTSIYSNDYSGLQVSKIVRRSSVNENSDAKIEGLETEFQFFLSDKWLLDGYYAYTDAKFTRFESVDPLNPGAATAYLDNASIFAPIGGTATGFFADFKQFGPYCAAGVVTDVGLCTLAAYANGSALLSALLKYQLTDAGILWKSFGPVCTQPFFGLDSTTLPCPATDGVSQNLAGNRLPLSAETNYRLGLSRFFDRPNGTWVARVDYTYRGDTYSDNFNREHDKIPALDYLDFSLRFTSKDDSWYAGVYVRNVTDEDHIYAKYRSDPTIGGFANGVAIDPKIWGINFGVNF